MNHQEQQQFYKLLRLSLGLTQEFPVEGVKGQESDIYKIQNLKYKQQLSALFFDDADFLYFSCFFTLRHRDGSCFDNNKLGKEMMAACF